MDRLLIAMTNPDSTQAPVISVVIPTYNRCQWLKVALDSVLQETRLPLLVHVFDNASTDETRMFVQGMMRRQPRLRDTRDPVNLEGLPNTDEAMREFLKRSGRFETDSEIHTNLLIPPDRDGYVRCLKR